jgi:hypothetical protein
VALLRRCWRIDRFPGGSRGIARSPGLPGCGIWRSCLSIPRVGLKSIHKATAAAILLLGLLLWPGEAWAHAGAPYPVLLEEPVGPYLVSALADPDVGGGTFYLQVALANGAELPAGTRVTLRTWPEDGHLSPAAYGAERRRTRYGERFVAEIPFDAEGLWQIELTVEGPAGEGMVPFGVEVTPPGTWLTTLACLLPFAAAALIWLRAALRRRPPAQRDKPVAH